MFHRTGGTRRTRWTIRQGRRRRTRPGRQQPLLRQRRWRRWRPRSRILRLRVRRTFKLKAEVSSVSGDLGESVQYLRKIIDMDAINAKLYIAKRPFINMPIGND